MAGRKAKGNIEYGGWRADMFDTDAKIDMLLMTCGWIGFSIYFFLCQKSFQSNGYYYEWSENDAVITARKMGCGITDGDILNAVNCCLDINLFNREIYDKYSVLTSRAIQKSYWVVLSRRREKCVIEEYWLLKDDECKGCTKSSFATQCCTNAIQCNTSCATNSHLQHDNSHLQHDNKEIVQQMQRSSSSSSSSTSSSSTSSNSISISSVCSYKPNDIEHTHTEKPSIEDIQIYCTEKGYVYTSPAEFFAYNDAKGWMVGSSQIVKWEHFVDKWEEAEKRKRKDKNKFNDFDQRKLTSDDLEDLEAKLLKGSEQCGE